MLQKIVLIFLIIFSFQYSLTWAYTQADLKLFYDRLYTKIELKSQQKPEKILHALYTVEKKLQSALKTISSTKNQKVLNTILAMNREKIVFWENKSISILSQENSILPQTNTSQTAHPQYIINLLNNGYTYLQTSPYWEFNENGVVYKFSFKKYYEIDINNHAYFLKNRLSNGVIVFNKNKYILTSDFTKERKYTYKDLEGMFTHFVDAKNPYTLESWTYYGYRYNYYIFFDDTESFSQSDFLANKIDFKTTLFIKDGEKYFFSNEYQKVKLAWESMISQIVNKNQFLWSVVDDNRFFSWDYEDILLQIQDTTKNITSGINNNDQKIRKIYDYIVNEVHYYDTYITDGNKQVFSWVLTYKNKTGVCDGYTKLFLYMLSFAGISDVEIKRGFAYDNGDFPNYWHAWVRIWEAYYDPTFDDPIGGSRNGNYYYFGIPKVLMYANRFDGTVIPENLKKMSLDERKALVIKNMYELFNDYRNFALMNTIKNRKFLWLEYSQKITLPLILEKMKPEEVHAGKFYHEWYEFVIRSLSYYALTDSNIETIILSPKIDLEEMYLLKWYKDDGSFDYRLAYDVIFE